jgi:outer membrane protein TolC
MKKILLFFSVVVIIYADSIPLSPQKKEILDLKRQQIQKDMSVSRKSWISPLMLSISVNKSDGSAQTDTQTKSAGVSWQQDLFRSGGIYYTIENSKATGAANLLGVDIQEATYLKQLYTLKAQTLRDILKKEQDGLTLKNMDIDLLIIKAKYKAGLSDISELNQATINRDNARTNLIIVKNALSSEIFELKKLTNSDNTDAIIIPNIQMITQKQYLAQNLELLQYKEQDIAQESSWKKTQSSYLPKLTFNGSYAQKDVTADATSYYGDYSGSAYNYGLTLSMPLDVSTFDSIESAKLQYMQVKSSQLDRQLELEQEYAKRINNIKDYKEKITVAQ